MIQPNPKQKRLNKITIFLQTASLTNIAIYSGVLISIFICLPFAFWLSIIKGISHSDVLLFGILAIMIGMFYGCVVSLLMLWQRRIMDDRFGVQFNGQDRLELILWAKHGIRPVSKNVQPILGDYVQYTHDIVYGKKTLLPPLVQLIVFIMTLCNVAIQAIQIYTEPGNHIFNFLIIICAIPALIVFFPIRSGKQNWFVNKVNKRAKKVVARMQSQL